jgi:CDP-diacylglycerol---glycerol-3-phosphate 3-phosphatidyltransferase
MLENLKPIFNATIRPVALGFNALGIHPNHITLSGLVFFVIAGYFSAVDQWFWALILVITGALFDGLDGVLARESGKKSTFGAILDSSCDRLTEIFLLLGVLIFYCNHPFNGYWGIVLCFTAVSGSLMVSYVKARCEGVGIPCKSGLLQRPERIILLCFGLKFGPTVMFWILLGMSIFTSFTVIQRLFEAAWQCKKLDVKGDNVLNERLRSITKQ